MTAPPILLTLKLCHLLHLKRLRQRILTLNLRRLRQLTLPQPPSHQLLRLLLELLPPNIR